MSFSKLGFASRTVNEVVRKSFGLEFRSDWKIVGVSEDGKIDLERSRVPQIVARKPLLLPSFIVRPEVVAHISFDGTTILGPKRFETELREYKRQYQTMTGIIPGLQIMDNHYFQDYIRVYGKTEI